MEAMTSADQVMRSLADQALFAQSNENILKYNLDALRNHIQIHIASVSDENIGEITQITGGEVRSYNASREEIIRKSEQCHELFIEIQNVQRKLKFLLIDFGRCF